MSREIYFINYIKLIKRIALGARLWPRFRDKMANACESDSRNISFARTNSEIIALSGIRTVQRTRKNKSVIIFAIII